MVHRLSSYEGRWVVFYFLEFGETTDGSGIDLIYLLLILNLVFP